ncbi:hypothetical protein Hthe01_18640 [Hydrogenophilus thermoluteolus]|uniref:hypothetical protein n=1 Tax=Hydrogenophilus thermoluteolus TaxID=297 RepID=UPI0024A36E86|nr:hypothetical protein [Hydrogenophilus thermoluteolus]GLW61515.1 hypothetical protein Hthe01_18640 [Hydrogenophilus thermoluteolus]
MSGIRIVLTVTEANPELYAALKEVPSRLRAERVRTLATLGLATIAGSVKPSVACAPPPPGEQVTNAPHVAEPQKPSGPKSKALSFAKSLGDEV